MSKDLDTISTYAYLYGIDELKDFVQAENLKEVKTKMVIDESDSDALDEAKVKGLTMLKNQGNVYMFEAKGQDFTHIVGENYNKAEQILENAKTYNNKEDADKDYMERCGIGGVKYEINRKRRYD